jgi:adenylate cyclase class 2
MQQEIEAKFHLSEKNAIRPRLTQSGFVCTKPETLMRRCNFQFAAKDEFSAGKKWARVRDEGDKVTMTVKEITDINNVTGTLETELVIDDFDKGCALLTACGLHRMSLHENRRETWKGKDVVITIDTWPDLDPILEIEAVSVAVVDTTCTALGLDRKDAFYKPVDFVYGQKYGVTPEEVLKLPEITFEKPPNLFLKITSPLAGEVA